MTMKIELVEITVRDLFNGYLNRDEEGVVGYGGLLDIRPAYQREFVYAPKQQSEVIRTIIKGYPLNVMYWIKTSDDKYELLDGQQRTLSICKFLDNDFSIDERPFHSFESDEQEKILKYKLQIYICSNGTDSEIIDWFQIINIAGEKLEDQEIRNAIYRGSWLTEAKRYFSKTNCPAYGIASKYMSGSCIRQKYLETAIKWISNNTKNTDSGIREYMGQHQHDQNSSELWLYFNSVIEWVKTVFPKYRDIMKSVEWGFLYNEYNKNQYDTTELESEINRLILDDDVTNKKGIYEYLLSGKKNERALNIRAFTENMKREAYERQNGICEVCGEHFEIDEMEADHIDPWHSGGKTNSENCQMLCKSCNRRKSGK